MDHASDAIESRLIALSQVHNVLTDRSWAHVALHDIVAQAVEPYRSRGENRIHVQGPSVQIPPRMALPLAMALQELVTKAVKYGALSNGTGQIRVHWALDSAEAPQRLHLMWEELEGPLSRGPFAGASAHGSLSAAWLKNLRARCGLSSLKQASYARSTLHW